MKKFLLTLIVTMLTTIGAWAQGDIPTQDVGALFLYPSEWATTYSDFYGKIDWNDNGATGNTSISNVQSSDPEFVTASIDGQGWQVDITPKKKTASPVKVSVDVTKTYNDGSTPAKTIRAEYSVTVLGYTCTFTITPDPGTGISLKKGQNSTDRYYVSTVWYKGDAYQGTGTITVESANSDIASIVDYYSWENSFFIKGVADGETSITVKSAYSGQVETKTFTVNVFDPTIATSIDAASEITMVCESQKQFSVNLLPNTATNFTSITCDIPGVTCEKVGDNIVNGVINFNIDASTISDEKTGKITITAGTVTKEINLIIKAPVTLTSMSISPSEEQIIKVGDNFTITITPDPEDATYSLDKTFSDVISCVEGTNSITVTGQKPGRTELVLTPDNKSELAKSIWVTVTQPITDATVTMEGVPTSTRVGVTGAKAVVKVNGVVAGSDFGITYTSSDENVVKVNAAGELEFVGVGNATITATLNPATSTFYTGSTTITSANINVGAEITGSFTGNLEAQTVGLADVLTIGSGYPIASWTPAENGCSTLYYVESDDESIVRGSYTQSNNGGVISVSNMQLVGYGAGTTTVRVKAVYGKVEYINGGNVIQAPLAVKYSEPISVTVTDVIGELTVSTNPLSIDINGGVATVPATASWNKTGEGISTSIEPSSSDEGVAKTGIEWDGVKITPQGLGDATITVKAKWTKTVNGDQITKEIIKTFKVTVGNKLFATRLDAIADQQIEKGKTETINVSFAPSTATFTVTSSNSDKITANFKSETENGVTTVDYTKLVISATNASVGDEATITITPVSGSSADPVTFNVTVAKPKLPVSDVKPKSIFYVGEEYETELVMGGGLELGVDYTQDYVLSNNVATNGATEGAISLDRATGKIVALNAGTAHIQATFTPKEGTDAYNVYDIWSNGMDIAVLPGKYSLEIDVENHNIEKSDETATTTLKAPVIKLNGKVQTYDASKYDIEYSVAPTYPGVSIEGNTVSITSAAEIGAATIKAVLTPKGGDADNYEGFTAYTQINIEPKSTDKHGIAVTVVDGVLKIKSDYAGAYGTLVYENYVTTITPTIDLSSCSGITGTGAEGALTNDDVINAIKAANKIEIEGLIKNTDMQIFSSWVGGSGSNLIDLNMGEATLTEAVTTNADGNDYVANISFVQPVLRQGNNNQLVNLKKLALPHPAAGQTVLPAMFGQKWLGARESTNAFEELVVSDGWTEIGASAFDNQGVTKLSLPNSLLYIREAAFFGHHMHQLFLPPNVDVIESRAFSNDPSSFEDVFFTGRTAPTIVDTDAFSSATQCANNAVDKSQATAEGTITRNAYKSGSNYTCMMHYPGGLTKEELATYVDPKRVYDATERTKMVGDKSGNGCAYSPWTAEFWEVIKGAGKGSYSFANLQVYDGKIEAAYLDPVFGTVLTWPSQEQQVASYAIAGSGYHWDGTSFNAEEMARQGIYQFVLARGDASPDNHDYIFERDYTAGLWWSICVPFNMPVEDIKKVFGDDTKVVRFSKVIRDANADKKYLRLEFTNSVMGDNNTLSTGNYDGSTGILAHRPYMIKPSGDPLEGDYARMENGVLRRVYPNYDWITGALIEENVVAVDKSDVSTGITYTFKGNHSELNNQGKEVLMPQYSYFLSALKDTPDDHQFFFQMGEKGRLHAHTAIVLTDNGAQDAEDFFTPTSGAPIFKSVFGDVEDDATDIEKVELVFGNEKFTENVKVYTINGQLVNGSNLAPGLYIKNGKKFIVK